ncbi:hypothetical protein Tco_0969909 [Tanacetum coccineum]
MPFILHRFYPAVIGHSFFNVLWLEELMDTSQDLFSKYSSYIGLNKLSKSSLDGVFIDSADESSLINYCETGSKLSYSETIAVSSFQDHLSHLLDNKLNQIHESTSHLVFCREGVRMEFCCTSYE